MTNHLLPPVYTLSAADVAELTRAELARDGRRVSRGAYVSRALPFTLGTAARAALDVLPEGALYPDLVNRLATEASKSARHVLNMCVRALDYVPPVDLTFTRRP